MRKTRNSFFTEAGMSYQGYMPNNAMNMPMQGAMPYQAGTSYNSFYSGPNMGMNNEENSIESRISKIERQINRLDHRITKLESTSNNTYIEDIDTNGNMYML